MLTIFHFCRHSIFDVYSRRKFKFVYSANNISTAIELCLCEQCSNHLTLDSEVKKKDRIYERSSNTWPGFFRYFLSNEHFHNIYGLKLWQFIPITWRHWWIDVARSLFSQDISLQHPHCVFIDKSKDNNIWNDDIDCMLLGRLRDTSNKYLMPCVLCPWGCSEYTHR